MARVVVPTVITSPVSGSALQGVTIGIVRNADSSVPPIYPDASSASNGTGASAITTDQYGNIVFSGGPVWVEQGTYRLTISGQGLTSRTIVREFVSGDGIVETAPVGAMQMFGGTVAPTGWLLCQGQVVSQTTYAKLYAVIGATFNTGGEGAGNFRLPNMQQRFPLGLATAGTGSTLGGSGGAIDHAHTVAAHAHNVPAHYHSIGTLAVAINSVAPAVSINDGGHQHNVVSTNDGGAPLPTINGRVQVDSTGGGGNQQIAFTNTGSFGRGLLTAVVTTGITATQASHNHIATPSGSVGATAGSSGDASLATDAQTPTTNGNNPPFLAVNFIIRHGNQ